MPRYFQPHVVRAVATALGEHVPAKGVVDIIESYRAGPELWYTGAPVEMALSAYLLVFKWYAHHVAGDIEHIVDHIIERQQPHSGSNDFTWDLQAVHSCSQICSVPSPTPGRINVSNATGLIDITSVADLLDMCADYCMYTAERISVTALPAEHAPAAFYGIRSAHYTTRIRQGHFVAYENARFEAGCMIDDSACQCGRCRYECHTECRRLNDANCSYKHQCLCACEYCGVTNDCVDTNGKCPNAGLLCFTRWRPPAA